MRGMTVSKPHTPLPLNMTRRPTNVPGTPTLGQYRHKSAGSALSPARPTPLTIYQDCGVYVVFGESSWEKAVLAEYSKGDLIFDYAASWFLPFLISI